MTIDNTRAIKAFAQARIDQLLIALNNKSDSETEGRIDELKMILKVCDGLAKQNELLSVAYAEANIPI